MTESEKIIKLVDELLPVIMDLNNALNNFHDANMTFMKLLIQSKNEACE